MKQYKYTCPKCNHRKAEVDSIRTTGAGFSRFFDIQNRKFTVVTCANCGYSEFYRAGKASAGGNVLDFLTN
ncbi:MAG TPA: zinc ribbon domain-containing protein [Prolixibacteraceae bacterium]|nr:zinc ribbon domain-containing protein [Prolixibacteraceae bacterium]